MWSAKGGGGAHPNYRERERRTAKYQAALEGGHDVLVLISEVWGGFSPEAMRFLWAS